MANTLIEIVCKGSLAVTAQQSKPIVNVFHFALKTPGSAFSKVNVTSAFNTAICTPWAAAASVDYSMSEIDCRVMDDATDPYLVTPVTIAGTVTGDCLPAMNTVFVYMKPSIRSRKAQGNKKFAGIAESDTTGNLLNTTGLSHWNPVAAAILAGFTDSDGNVWVPTVVSRRPPANYKTNPTTLVFNNTNQCNVNQRIGRLKRREVKSVY